jgi:hypothetical protein
MQAAPHDTPPIHKLQRQHVPAELLLNLFGLRVVGQPMSQLLPHFYASFPFRGRPTRPLLAGHRE